MWANLECKLLEGNGVPRKYIREKGNNTYSKSLWATMNICQRNKIRALAQKTTLF